MGNMFEWDKLKGKENQSKHGIPFADTFGVFEDPNAVTIEDFRSGEQRYHWNGRFRPYSGGGLHVAGGKHPDHFRTQGRAL